MKTSIIPDGDRCNWNGIGEIGKVAECLLFEQIIKRDIVVNSVAIKEKTIPREGRESTVVLNWGMGKVDFFKPQEKDKEGQSE